MEKRSGYRIGIMIGTLVCVFGQFALAQEFGEEKVVKYASSRLIEGLLEALEMNYEEKGDGMYVFKMSDYKVMLKNYGEDIQLYAGFAGQKITLTRINEWNKTKRFSRAYLDDDGDAILEADLDFEGGVTGDTLIRFLRIFENSLEKFAEHID